MCCRNDISCTKQTMARGKKIHTDTKLCTTKFAQSISQYNYVLQSVHFVLQNLHKALPSTTFVLQSLHEARPSTTLYYKVCIKHFPIITTLYYKACTKAFPVLLCTTKFAQRRSQYYFVLQSLHRVIPSTTLYYKVCTKQFPILLRTSSHCKAATNKRCWNMLKHFLTIFFKGKSLAPKWEKCANKSPSQPWYSDSNTIYDVQLQKTLILRMQRRQQATLTQPLHCDIEILNS